MIFNNGVINVYPQSQYGPANQGLQMPQQNLQPPMIIPQGIK